ncbi:MAG: cysteine desulfurase [Chloroflexi bacterium]|nr:cysteine desulfurase [Chloroflexota bacterium]
MRDLRATRQDFPILQRTVRGRPLVYLDSAATSQKPLAVIEAIEGYYRTSNANIHRGIHTLGDEATEAYENARAKVARFIGAPSPRGVVFVRNTTEGINLVAYAWGRRNVRADDEIILTEMEHHSNLIPWQMLANEVGARLRFVPLAPDGTFAPEALERLLSARTRLVALPHMSNVLGTINPVRAVADLAHAAGALVVVDGAQSVPHLPVDVREMGCDFLAFSGHKMCAPTGIGVLWGREDLLEAMEPFMAGGGMIREVHWDYATWDEIPHRFEAGTPNIAGAVGLGAAVDYLEGIGMAAIRQHEVEITAYALEALRHLGDVTLYGPRDAQRRGGVVSFNVAGVHPHDLGTVLDEHGVAIRAGHHCCQPLMRKLGVPATARASFYLYNVPEEIEALVAAVQHARELFSGVRAR